MADDPLAARQRTGYLPESAVLYPELRVDQLLGFCADVRGLRGPSRAARLAAVKQAWAQRGIGADAAISPVGAQGARVVECD